ncbi:SAV_6107 family HEPN domain-containing protein [Gordonia sp. ABSL1-1]|uniref:SAV_6107 family HEPN domain-containing protein n=1 Tax=Gordonia sp. ABSL1-1 TaxID=3053923 RepID=UPI002573CE7C|nr:SAV_6107 family HEPN domain-containing protein [Gordonia sp. ABSL1-1]MDL9937395.1 SAV_6107 family HEPN domain-containing protein [Gordonia sp. ABSL1-1]
MGSHSGSRRVGRATADPMMIGRARDLLDRAYLIFDNADAVPDDAERFRQYYLAALRGAGAALAVHEAPTRARRGSTNAWTRIAMVVPALADDADRFAALSAMRMRIESGIVRTVEPARADALRVAVAGFLHRTEELVIAYEQGRLSGMADPMGYTA